MWRRGEANRAVRLASVSKPVAALAVLVAAEEGVVDLDEPAGPPGSTVRHLLAHTSGLAVRGHGADRAPRASPDLLQRGVPRPRRAPRRPCRDALRGVRARGGLRTTRDRARPLGRPRLRDAGVARRRPRDRPRAARASPGRGRDPRRDGLRPVPGPVRRAPRPWPLRSARLGSRRAAEHDASVMDGGARVCANVRPLRRNGHVPVGRPRGARRLRSAHHARVRRLGEGGVAALRRRCARRARP